MDQTQIEQVFEITPIKVSGTFYRILREKYGEQALSMTGSLQVGGRYNPPREFGALYVGKDKEVCRGEIRRNVGAIENLSYKMVCAEICVTLNTVLDLTDEENLETLGIKREDLLKVTGNDDHDYELTRTLARKAREEGFEALKVPSVTSRGVNFVIFKDCLEDSSTVRRKDVYPVQ